MTTPFSGGCACGSVRYTCNSEPIAMLNCHCKDCQISSGAPYASGFIAAVASIQVAGKPSTHIVTAASGGKSIRSFCGTCGTPLFTRGEDIPVMSVRFPTLDDQEKFKPMLDIWTSRAQSWTCLDTDIPHFKTTPPVPANKSKADDFDAA